MGKKKKLQSVQIKHHVIKVTYVKYNPVLLLHLNMKNQLALH